MRRRQFFHYVQGGAIASLGVAWSAQAQSGGSLGVQWFGHTCFLFTGSGQRILSNPFQPRGCTKNLPAPKVASNIVMISSRLLDEGFVEGLPGRPKLLFEPGSYNVNGIKFQGVRTNHDRVGGYRFGTNVAWAWTQGGIKILQLGGIAAPITLEQRILMGKPDLLIIPVGGSEKAYTPEEAKAAINFLEPRIVIPSHYLTKGADPKACDLKPLEAFLEIMAGTTIRRVGGSSISLSPSSLPASLVINVLSL
ncbi:MBL fold metallo-hydrolase [Thermosynechococcaceae cyanobacterium BACA0444]|uniref:MBL fold metallo-hydrolase n=1 Tax=Pseudocalidococcus azoricus BACA0444 TaxID=2918990 RepID=A0AAE4FSX5_9CYAN|nr:MBL fold metallo-hydrolase [Pseudocalidococcus azoricus]MDS3860732.1 MBL fold metallo-hydrolase [Pseudocalidococcus azoricus BACA0444]